MSRYDRGGKVMGMPSEMSDAEHSEPSIEALIAEITSDGGHIEIEGDILITAGYVSYHEHFMAERSGDDLRSALLALRDALRAMGEIRGRQ